MRTPRHGAFVLIMQEISAFYFETTPYPCLNLLESALVCCRTSRTDVIPEPLLEDLAALFDSDTLEAEIKNLEAMSVLIRTEEGISLNREGIHYISAHLNQLKRVMIPGTIRK